jgi:hypothetical protein
MKHILRVNIVKILFPPVLIYKNNLITVKTGDEKILFACEELTSIEV